MALILAFGVVLLISVSLSGVATRTILSTALLFLLAGALTGQGGFGLVEIHPRDPLVTGLADIALFTVLFTDGQRASLPALREGRRMSGRALGLGMPLTMIGVPVPAHFLVGLDWPTAPGPGAARREQVSTNTASCTETDEATPAPHSDVSLRPTEVM